MSDATNDPVAALRASLQSSMNGYMEAFLKDGEEPPYRAPAIERCLAIVDEFVAVTVGPDARSTEVVCAAVTKCVLALNELNDECDEQLIESGERDCLFALLEAAAARGGVAVEDAIGAVRDW